MAEQPDKVSHASLNGIYVKAQELDRGHNQFDAPAFAPPGGVVDACAHASDASAHLSDVETSASGFDAQTHASR